MKKALVMFCAAALSFVLLVACGGNSSSIASSSAPSSVSSSEASQVETSSIPESSSSGETVDIAANLPLLLAAAGISSTIEIKQIDIIGMYGLSVDDIVAFAGAQSKTVSQDGGEILIIQAQPGKADGIKALLEAYRDSVASDDRYAEYEKARANVKDARVNVYGDIVVYASSALGEYAPLDSAMATAFES